MMNVSANLPRDRFQCAVTGLNVARFAPLIFVKELKECNRDAMLKHFLALNDADRLLRFGTVLPDGQVAAYVQKIDFLRDTVYGVVSDDFSLVAVGHLAFAPQDVASVCTAGAGKKTIAELGVSVNRSMRRMGLGRKLFERAIRHCRNVGVDILYSHCLSSNQALMQIVKKSGFEIERDHGEADAYLNLSPPDAVTVAQEVLEEQFAALDYTFKANTSAFAHWFDRSLQISPLGAALAQMHGWSFAVIEPANPLSRWASTRVSMPLSAPKKSDCQLANFGAADVKNPPSR
jgi:GNAT superfamily N-acetyltransferase